MKIKKQEVALAIELSKCASPETVLQRAMDAPPPASRRVYASDFVPAMDALMDKGYTQVEAARMMASLGCTFSVTALQKEHKRLTGGRGQVIKKPASLRKPSA